jgi:catechol 2,3-dioxygenase-like lactoylglutathione lyase family enzyme
VARVIGSRCVLAVRNLGASTQYYTDVLGFRRDPVDAAGWSFLTKDSFQLMLGECPEALPVADLGDHSYFAYIYIDGIDQYYEEVVARGAEPFSKPSDKPWGLREFGLRTVDGHRITFGQPLRKP